MTAQSDASQPNIARVACHEAGHAVVGYALEAETPSVSIAAVDYGGGIQYGVTSQMIRGTPAEQLIKELQMRLAGSAAERITYDDDRWLDGAKDDYRECRQSCRTYGPTWSDDFISRLMDETIVCAERILRDRWPAVEALVVALVRERKLTGAQVELIITGALNGRE